MRTHILISILLLLALIPMHGQKAKKIAGPMAGYVEYHSHQSLVDEKKKEAILQMWTPEQLQKEIDLIPAGGYVYFMKRSMTLDGAKLDLLDFIIKDSEANIILRESGDDIIPDYTPGVSAAWMSSQLIFIPDAIASEFTFHVVDKLKDVRTDFLISF